MRSQEDWEKWYTQPNPWGTEGTVTDLVRTEILLDRLKHASFTNTLDLGCGEGVLTNVMSALSRHTLAVDISSRAIERARSRFPGIDFRQGELLDVIIQPDIRAVPFDLILVSEVLYYLQTDEERLAAISGISRLGAPDCVYYFSVIVTGASKNRRYFTHDEFVRLLSAHFNVIDGFASVAEVPTALDLFLRLVPSRRARKRILKAWTVSRETADSRHMGYLAVKRLTDLRPNAQ
jgi:SAM-dependent methyltransferase